MVCFMQEDWALYLPATQLALNNRQPTAIGISPFFINHGYHMDLFPVVEEQDVPIDNKEKAA